MKARAISWRDFLPISEIQRSEFIENWDFIAKLGFKYTLADSHVKFQGSSVKKTVQ